MISQGLSKRQEAVIDYIKQYIKKNGQSPTIYEVAVGLKLKSKATISQHLGALEKKGYIRRVVGAHRGIIINQEEEGSVELPVKEVPVEIPLKGIVAAGQPIEAVEQSETIKVPKKLIPRTDRQYFALEVKGNSMIEDGIYDGEVVVVEARNYADNGDLVVAKDENNNVTLKYFYKENNRIRLEPRNKGYQPIYPISCEILGILRGITKR